MSYVIAEPCVAACDTACVEVCPVDCIHGPIPVDELRALPAEQRAERARGLQMYIEPDACICCGACTPECPVDAIFEEEDLPAPWRHYRELNARFFEGR